MLDDFVRTVVAKSGVHCNGMERLGCGRPLLRLLLQDVLQPVFIDLHRGGEPAILRGRGFQQSIGLGQMRAEAVSIGRVLNIR